MSLLDSAPGRERAIATLRRLAAERGSDVGRRIDRLKRASANGGGESLVDHYERSAHPIQALARRDASGVQLLFMLGVSALDGADGLE